MFVRDDEADKQGPQVVNHQQEPGGQFGRGARLGAKAAEAPLVFEFVEDVLGVGALPVQFLDLSAVHLVGQIGDVDGELMFVLVPKLRAAGRRRDALQRAGEDHPSGGFPAGELDPALGHLAGPQHRGSLPIRFLDTVERGAP